MHPYTNTINYLPRELVFLKNVILKERDPIKREIFSFDDISYIVNNITKFPVNAKNFFETSYSNKKMNYLNYF